MSHFCSWMPLFHDASRCNARLHGIFFVVLRPNHSFNGRAGTGLLLGERQWRRAGLTVAAYEQD